MASFLKGSVYYSFWNYGVSKIPTFQLLLDSFIEERSRKYL